MAIYELKTQGISGLIPVTFSEAGIRERDDLQRLLREHIDIIAPETLVIAEEFSQWEDSKRRIDLLAVDKAANLVVIELKRDEVGAHMELQALRYAAMASTLTFSRAISVYREHLSSIDSDLDPEESLLEFLGWEEADEDGFGQDVRIVLAAADFSKEITSTVLWLNDHGLDIRCVRLKPYRLENRILLDVQQVVPLPEAAEFQVQLRDKIRAEKAARNFNPDFTKYDVTVKGVVFEKLAKRRAIWQVINGLLADGISPEDIANAIPWKGRLFRTVEGKKSEEELAIELTEQMHADDVKPNLLRWFYRGDEPFFVNGRTYILSTQWGNRTEEAMGLLLEAFPGHQIGFVEHSAS